MADKVSRPLETDKDSGGEDNFTTTKFESNELPDKNGMRNNNNESTWAKGAAKCPFLGLDFEKIVAIEENRAKLSWNLIANFVESDIKSKKDETLDTRYRFLKPEVELNLK